MENADGGAFSGVWTGMLAHVQMEEEEFARARLLESAWRKPLSVSTAGGGGHGHVRRLSGASDSNGSGASDSSSPPPRLGQGQGHSRTRLSLDLPVGRTRLLPPTPPRTKS